MPYGVIHFFPGGTKAQYDAVVAEVHPSDGSLPPGQTFHAAGTSEGGWTVIAIHDSKESWERFRDETLLPKMRSVEGGLTSPPTETAVELATVLP